MACRNCYKYPLCDRYVDPNRKDCAEFKSKREMIERRNKMELDDDELRITKSKNIISKLEHDIKVNKQQCVDNVIVVHTEDLEILFKKIEELKNENAKKTDFIGSNNLIGSYMDWIKKQNGKTKI